MATTYVQAEGSDTWHWCTNCTQYPKAANIANSQPTRPAYDLCNQCLAKERNGTCTT